MAPGELIDLSLSTDEEASQSQVLGLGRGSVSKRAREDDFLLLQDDFEGDDGDFGNTWSANPAKRKRLSHEELLSPLRVGLRGEVEGSIGPEAGAGHENLSAVDLKTMIFTSSPHRDHAASHRAKDSVRLFSLSSDSDDDFPEKIPRISQEQRNQQPCFSERTAALLTRLEKPAKRKKTTIGGQKSDEKTVHASRNPDEAEMDSDKLAKKIVTKAPKKPRLNDEERAKAKEEREKVRAANKARKDEAKEVEQEQKRQSKQQKAKEKQTATALAEVNKSKLDKKVTSKEMIVDIPSSITGQVLNTQIREVFKNLEIDVTLYQAPVPNIIKWRRKVKARYNPEKEYWEPIEPMEIEDEKHIMCLMSAQEFVDLASSPATDNFPHEKTPSLNLNSHVQKLKSKFPKDSKPIYLIEGLTTWMRKNKTLRNRAYQSAVLSQMDNPAENPVSRRSKLQPSAAHEYIDEDIIEDGLLRLQVMNNCLIHHTANTTETAEWVATFTQHISTIPSK